MQAREKNLLVHLISCFKMVNISTETPEQTDHRLRRVMRDVRLALFDELYYYHEFPAQEFPNAVRKESLAIVRDGGIWSQLVPLGEGADHSGEMFGIFSCHFADGVDNSGFVGWLATILKDRLGTGVFVVCGYNSRAGGVYDYWGYPASLQTAVVEVLESLQASF